MITLNLNKLNPIVKTHRMAKEIKKKTRPMSMLPTRDSL